MSDGLCSAMFETEEGTGVCEKFGPHEVHAGVVMHGVFRCHRCRRPKTPGGSWRESLCRCAS